MRTLARPGLGEVGVLETDLVALRPRPVLVLICCGRVAQLSWGEGGINIAKKQ